ncbi:5,6-dimethylbenzimidazole synthase [Nocardioides aquaticus]|uniref:Nicotinate-nucleotide--dimethylbenzimidazole phosphoribosyltransferase n=1 Tax=Nocardioides aquaticus TaxID=160826 RepID=A0ABX8EHA7_9ACTN|nr:5,6-dimethylbenzimidazole synthase [Nocardioides aquaticus]QVT79255.1 5,6-dimethylbenzimidazole synthase [Nocardioides aquaticus]
MTWNRPVPLLGDQTSASERAAEVEGWAFPQTARETFYDVVAARRDVRRFRPDPVDPETVRRVLAAAHMAPSVGHSQPWRFIVVSDPATRDRAARMADEQRLRQARQMDPEAGRRLLDLQLEGIREAPLGVVVACDRRTAAAGVLGRATFPDADMWSCACAIQNLWLAARAEGLGVGWVTLFEQHDLEALVGVPDGVVTLGWLCLGWPDERPPAPGLERAGWSRRQPVDEVIFAERWSEATPAPPSHLRAPANDAVVGARDEADVLLTPPGSLGLLDRYVDRVEAAMQERRESAPTGQLLLVAGRHPVTSHGVSAYRESVTEDVLAASKVGESAGAVAAAAAGLDFEVVDAGTATGDLVTSDALSADQVSDLIERGRGLGAAVGSHHVLQALGEVGIGNTTVAATLAAVLLDLPASDVVGLGAGADTAMVRRKTEVVEAALARVHAARGPGQLLPEEALACVGGPEFCVLAGAVLGAASTGAVSVLDGLATSVAALAAVRIEPGAAAYLVAGQRSGERAHATVLEHLGLEPLLDLRLRAGEGVGATLACAMLISGLKLRRGIGRTAP